MCLTKLLHLFWKTQSQETGPPQGQYKAPKAALSRCNSEQTNSQLWHLTLAIKKRLHKFLSEQEKSQTLCYTNNSRTLLQVKLSTLTTFYHSHTIIWNTNAFIESSRYHHISAITGTIRDQQHSALMYTHFQTTCLSCNNDVFRWEHLFLHKCL